MLYPAPLRDLLLQLATANLFRAHWSDQIQHEWVQSLLLDRPDLDPEKLRRTVELMNGAVLDCIVSGYEHLIGSLTLPDANDRHVVAAAVHAKADAIITYNLKDFPATILSPLHLEAIHPDDFLTYQVDLNDAAVIQATSAICRRLRMPKLSGKEYLDTLLSLGLPKTVAALRPFEKLISP